MYSELTSSNLQWPSSEFDSTYAVQNESFSPETENERNENAAQGSDINNTNNNVVDIFDDVFVDGRETMCERKEITYSTARVSFQRPSIDSNKAADGTINTVRGEITEESEEEVVVENLYYEPPQLWGEEDAVGSER